MRPSPQPLTLTPNPPPTAWVPGPSETGEGAFWRSHIRSPFSPRSGEKGWDEAGHYPDALQVKLQTCDSASASTMMLPFASTRSLSA